MRSLARKTDTIVTPHKCTGPLFTPRFKSVEVLLIRPNVSPAFGRQKPLDGCQIDLFTDTYPRENWLLATSPRQSTLFIHRSTWRPFQESRVPLLPRSLSNRSISPIPQCFRQITHNVPFLTEMCTRVHIFATKWCIVGNRTCALWNL